VNILAIIGCLMAGATIGVLLMSIFAAGSDADDWYDAYEADAAREEVEARIRYREQQRAAQ